jgi:hypothetical protein
LKESVSVLEFGLNISRCHQAKMSNADKPVREDVEEEAPDELLGSESDEPGGARVFVIPGTEGDRLPIKGKEPLVGDGYPVSVMAEVAEDMPGPTEGRFGVDDPLGSPESSDPPFEDRWVSPVGDVAGEAEHSLFEGLLEAVEKLTPDHL